MQTVPTDLQEDEDMAVSVPLRFDCDGTTSKEPTKNPVANSAYSNPGTIQHHVRNSYRVVRSAKPSKSLLHQVPCWASHHVFEGALNHHHSSLTYSHATSLISFGEW